MRLLVHGGNSYNERQRIGIWSDTIVPGTLEDRYGLSDDHFAFGMGNDNDLGFLILRKQVSYQSRTYPISILLDPDAQILKDYDWNAARLALLLFGGSDPPGDILLSTPEAINSEQKLNSLIEGLSEIAPAPLTEDEAKQMERIQRDCVGGVPRFLAFWTAVSLADLNETLVVPPAFAGLGPRPSLGVAAQLFDQLPIAFRPGNGWLIGGSRRHGEVFGAALVIDDNLAPEAVDAQLLTAEMERGANLLLAFNTVSKSKYADCCKQEFATPLKRWPQEVPADREALFTDLELLAAILDRHRQAAETDAQEVVEVPAEWRDAIKRTGPLHPQIRQAAMELACAGSGPLNYSLSSWILSLRWDLHEKIDDPVLIRLDPPAVRHEFVTRWQDQPEIRSWLNVFERSVHADVYAGIFASGLNVSAMGELFNVVLQDIGQHENQSEAEQMLKQVFKSALECTERQKEPLTIWLAFENKEPKWAWPLLEDMLHMRSLNQPKQSKPPDQWEPGYIVFANDPGGLALNDYEIAPQSMSRLVDCLVAQSNGRLAKAATSWAVALVKSPFRKKLSIHQKLWIHNRYAEQWKGLDVVNALYQRTTRVKHDFDTEELEYLLFDLKQMVERDQSSHSDAPNLAGLLFVFKKYAAEEFKFMGILKPKLAWKDYDPWLKPWRKIDPPVFQRELLRLLLGQDNRFIDDLKKSLEKDFGSDLMTELGDGGDRLFDQILNGGDEASDKRFGDLFEKLFMIYQKDDCFRTAVTRAFDAAVVNEEKRATLLRRFMAHGLALKWLQKCLSQPHAEKLDKWCKGWLDQQAAEGKKKAKEALIQTATSELSIPFSAESLGSDDEYVTSALQDLNKIADPVLAGIVSQPALAAELERRVPAEVWDQTISLAEQQRRNSIRSKLKDLLCYGTGFAESSRQELKAMLRQYSGDDIFRELLSEELAACQSNEIKAKEFCHRFIWQGESLADLFAVLPGEMRRAIVARGYQYQPEGFQEQARMAFEQPRLANGEMHIYHMAILDFLATDAKKEREQIGIHHFSTLEWQRIDGELDELLKDYEESAEKKSSADIETSTDGTPSQAAPAATDKFPKRVLKRFVHLVTGITLDEME